LPMAEQTSNPNRPLLVLMLFELLKRHPLSLYCLLSLRLNLLFPFRAISSVRAWSLNSWLLLCCLDRRHLLPIFESSSGMVPTLSSEGVLHSRRVLKSWLPYTRSVNYKLPIHCLSKRVSFRVHELFCPGRFPKRQPCITHVYDITTRSRF